MRRNAPTRVRRSSPSTPPGARSPSGASYGDSSATAIERNFSISNGRPSRPIRSCLKKIGLPIDRRTAIAAAMRSGERKTSATAETSRSSTYFTRNCQPAGSAGRGATRGSPPRCSICVIAGIRSKRRGTIAVGMPRSSQRRTIRSSTSSGAVENVITTCSILKRAIASSRSQLAPATGMPSSSHGVDEGLLVEERDRPKAELGVVEEALGDERADAPGADDERRPDALPHGAGSLLRPVPRQATRADVGEANAQSRAVSVARSAVEPSRTRPVRTSIAASVVAPRIVRRSSSVWMRNRRRYSPRDQ